MQEEPKRVGETKRVGDSKARCCCQPTSPSTPETAGHASRTVPDTPDAIRDLVREKYGALAEEGAGGGAGCCGFTDEATAMQAFGYTADQAASVPEGASLGLGCGNPLAYAGLQSGETVLDLGSGAGVDCFLAAREVGPQGRAIGVDMTPSMLARARANAAKAGMAGVEFRLGEIESLPVADGSVDAVISNCVINLSPDKPRVFREAYRALRPGGRMLVSDLVWIREPAPELRRDAALYAGCLAGASLREDYLRTIREAGFVRVEVVEEQGYGKKRTPFERPGKVAADTAPDENPLHDAIRSIRVRAWKE